MWYWLVKLERMVFALPFVVYYPLRGIPFSLRCKTCGKWLLEQQCLRPGLCRNCHKEMIFSQHPQFWNTVYTAGRGKETRFASEYSREVAKRVRDGRILDVGCGRGDILSRVQSEHRELFGFDISLEGIEQAKERVNGGNFCLGNAGNIPFKSDTFDCLICSEVLEHIPSDEPMRELYRVLKPNGIAIITVPNGRGPAGDIPTHIRLFSFNSFMDYVTAAGFKIISTPKLGLHVLFLHGTMRILSQIVGRPLPFASPFGIRVPEFLALHFLIECRKPPE